MTRQQTITPSRNEDQDAARLLIDVDTVVRTELVRVDAKASGLFGGLGLVLAVAGLSTGVGGRATDLSPALAVLGWGITGCLAGAVMLAALAMRPRIRPSTGRYGQLIYTPGSPAELVERARQLADDTTAEAQAAENTGGARSLRLKFYLVRTAIDVAVWGSVTAAAAAGITALATS